MPDGFMECRAINCKFYQNGCCSGQRKKESHPYEAGVSMVCHCPDFQPM